MNTELIGANAGSVWVAVNTADAYGVKQFTKIGNLKDKELYAALGWLARENKIAIAPDPADEKEIIVTLVNE